MSSKVIPAADRFRTFMAKLEPDTVELTAPSGFTYVFKKTVPIDLVALLSRLPQAATSEAVSAWKQDGVGADAEEQETAPAVTEFDQRRFALLIHQRLLSLSYDPKLVDGPATAPDEVDWSDVPATDRQYLFNYVAGGGAATDKVATFPEGPQRRPLASASRRKQRDAAK